MGYTTTFKGKLSFTKEMTASQLVKLNSILGEDCRDHPEWKKKDLSYIQFELTKDFTGIQWDGGEKFYDSVECANLIIHLMQKDYPDFGLSGKLAAQGEESDDRWFLKIENGRAIKEEIPLSTDEIICPDCGHLFKLSEAKKKRR